MSGRKTILDPFLVATGASMGGDIVGPWTDVHGVDNIFYALSFTGSPVGSFSFEASPDLIVLIPLPLGLLAGTTAAPAAAGSADQIGIDMTQLPARYVRMKYTRTSGTGSLTAWISGKAV